MTDQKNEDEKKEKMVPVSIKIAPELESLILDCVDEINSMRRLSREVGEVNKTDIVRTCLYDGIIQLLNEKADIKGSLSKKYKNIFPEIFEEKKRANHR